MEKTSAYTPNSKTTSNKMFNPGDKFSPIHDSSIDDTDALSALGRSMKRMSYTIGGSFRTHFLVDFMTCSSQSNQHNKSGRP
ncbi:hypothetical protein ACH5RR_018531 [Cinchona calisaya]|uniref:Uncharacterized protein n=1 Tax=Cinchona calisaya TaxID=153742 RepID=A0ABD2ZQF0_9GENT